MTESINLSENKLDEMYTLASKNSAYFALFVHALEKTYFLNEHLSKKITFEFLQEIQSDMDELKNLIEDLVYPNGKPI